MLRVYNSRYFDTAEGITLGDDVWTAVGQIGAAGVQVGLPLLLQSINGGRVAAGGPARGLAAINAFGRQVIETLNQIIQQIRAGALSVADGIANGERISAALSNPAYVYQAQRGSDAAALRDFKSRSSALLEQIRQFAQITAGGGTVPTATAAAGGTTPAATTAAGVGGPTAATASGAISGTTMILIAGGLAAILLLKQ